MNLSSVRRTRGFTLIEVMISLLLGLLVTAGVVAVFQATSVTSQTQNGLARLQENGRYLNARIAEDLRLAGGQFCSSAGEATLFQDSSNGIQPRLRAPLVRIPAFRLADWGGGPLTLAAAGSLSPRFFIQGYDCTASACTPAAPPLPGLPPQGTAAGNRVPGSDVLTVRYLRGNGWRVGQCASVGGAADLTLVADEAEIAPHDPPLDAQRWRAGDAAWLGSCSTDAQIFNVTRSGNVLSAAAAAGVICPDLRSLGNSDVRVFNFSRDFVTVTYYLALRADASPDTRDRVVPVLMRRETAGDGVAVEQELARGVERLDFLYGVERNGGAVSYVSAAEVEAVPSCPAGPALEPGSAAEGACAWRALRTIEVHLLATTVDDNFGLTGSDFAYRYSIDSDQPQLAPVSGSMPVSGLAAGRMLRREFVSLVAIRNYNL